MADKAFAEKSIQLQDGTDVVLKPLVIARQRRFMDAWDKIAEVKEGEPGFEVFINCCGIALEENFKGKFDALKADKEEADAGEFLNHEYKDYLENTLDLDTIYVVLEVCGGIKLNDPKLIEAAMEQLGQN